MSTNIAAMRKEYSQSTLDVESVLKNPYHQFEKWFQEAVEAKVLEANAMTLSTYDGMRSRCRIVLLKDIQPDGLTFFTNYNSDKAMEMAKYPWVSVLFFWGELERQVRVEGLVKKTDSEYSRAYFNSRPRGSRIGAHVSPQSQIISSRVELEQAFKEKEKEFAGNDIPLPDFWGGYILVPDYFEFWQGRPSRLHDRVFYKQEENHWIIGRLAP